MTRRVVITGLGTISPMGLDVPTVWDGLVSGKSGIKAIERFDTEPFPVKFGGEVRGFDPLAHFDRKEARHLDRYTQYAMVAAEEARADSGLEFKESEAHRCGVILGSGIGGMETMEEQVTKLKDRGPRRVSPFLVPMMMINAASGQIAIRYGLLGPNFTTASACASANHAIGMAWQTITLGQADVMLTGGSEATVTPIGFAGFCAARALSKRNDAPEKASRPFDNDRDGFVLSEGAGLLMMEELEHARARGAKIYAEVLGFGMSDDASHITAPHEDGLGAIGAMRMALESAGISRDKVDYINAHGTSTKLGDVAETLAIKRLFEEHAETLCVSSTKSMAGHLLGASGGLEAVALAKTIETGTVHPTLNLETADPDCDLDYVPNEARKLDVRVGLSNSFGFGGHNTTLVFGKYSESA